MRTGIQKAERVQSRRRHNALLRLRTHFQPIFSNYLDWRRRTAQTRALRTPPNEWADANARVNQINYGTDGLQPLDYRRVDDLLRYGRRAGRQLRRRDRDDGPSLFQRVTRQRRA